MTTITVQRPLSVREPRAAVYAAALFSQLMALLQRDRARRAERREASERIAEAAAVRQYALRSASHDPRFAADLLAAADRHELADSNARQTVMPGFAATQAARNFTMAVLAARAN